MKTNRFYVDADRYRFDFKACSYELGYAQVDTSQDAHYFGTWANPWVLHIVNYCEGEVIEQRAETEEEFVDALWMMCAWNMRMGYKFGIDPGLTGDMAGRFIELGLGTLLH
jgi:hypothetical protein